MMRKDDIIRRIDELIEEGNRVLRNHDEWDRVKYGAMLGFRAGSQAFIERVYSYGHIYSREFSRNTSGNYLRDAECGIEILKAIRSEINGGWLFTVKGLVTVEIFSDFIEMARSYSNFWCTG